MRINFRAHFQRQISIFFCANARKLVRIKVLLLLPFFDRSIKIDSLREKFNKMSTDNIDWKRLSKITFPSKYVITINLVLRVLFFVLRKKKEFILPSNVNLFSPSWISWNICPSHFDILKQIKRLVLIFVLIFQDLLECLFFFFSLIRCIYSS